MPEQILHDRVGIIEKPRGPVAMAMRVEKSRADGPPTGVKHGSALPTGLRPVRDDFANDPVFDKDRGIFEHGVGQHGPRAPDGQGGIHQGWNCRE